MGIAFTAMAFKDCLENGGTAIKLDFIRSQSFKVADKQVRVGTRGDDGRMRFKGGDIVRERDDLYKVDCCVTGSKEGTPTDPKFPLINVFRENMFKKVAMLVGPGENFVGYTPVFEGDNAGPRCDAVFYKYVTEYCEKMGWHWEPQAAQMPHMNVLDLSVFPNMSRRHIALSRDHGGLCMLSEDDIWEGAKNVWENLRSF